MADAPNRATFARNLQYYLEKANKSRTEVCEALGIKYSTFTDWVRGIKYPRIDKIELLAAYFGIEKSDLIEDKAKPGRISDEDVKFALFGGEAGVTDEMYEEVRRFAAFLKEREAAKPKP